MFSRRRSVLVCAALALILGPALGQPEAEGPRPGKYRIFTIPTAKGIPLFLGSFVLEKGGRYQAYLPGDRMTGTGEYEYQPASKTVIWKTGPYQVEKWGHNCPVKSRIVAWSYVPTFFRLSFWELLTA